MTDRPTTAAEYRLREWINGKGPSRSKPNRWLDEALAEARQPDSEALREALEQIRDLQPNALGYIRRYGFVMDKVGPLADDADELDRWKVLAFSLYTDLCQANDEAERSLAALPPSDPPVLDALTEALHSLHSIELWRWWEPQADGGAIVRRGTSPEFAAAILARLSAQPEVGADD